MIGSVTIGNGISYLRITILVIFVSKVFHHVMQQREIHIFEAQTSFRHAVLSNFVRHLDTVLLLATWPRVLLRWFHEVCGKWRFMQLC